MELFAITHEKFKNSPDIPAAIVQKLAVRSTLKAKDVGAKLIERYEYKNMLKAIQSNLELMDHKQAVDTLFALGKLHKH